MTLDDAMTLVAKHQAKKAKQRELLRRRYELLKDKLAEAQAVIAADERAAKLNGANH